MKFRPVSKRADPSKLGITDPEAEAFDASKDENGEVDLTKAYPTPSSVPATSEQTSVLKILDEKGYPTEEKLYQREYQLRAAHQLLIKGAGTAQIAQTLNISIAEARKLKNELQARLINEVKTLDKNKVAGQALMFYDHIMAKGLQMIDKAGANKAKPELRNQIEALKVILQAQTDKQKFLVMSGFWNNPLDQGMTNYDSHIQGANDMRDMLTGIISGDEVEIILDETEDSDGIDLL